MKVKHLLLAAPFAAGIAFGGIAVSAEPIAPAASATVPLMTAADGGLILAGKRGGGGGGGGWKGGSFS